MVRAYVFSTFYHLKVPEFEIYGTSAGTGNRDKIFLATKFGFTPELTVRGDPEFVKSECEKSLKKLRTGHIDLYYQHRPAPDTPIEITVGAMAELVKSAGSPYTMFANI
jgi:aryl-alcohol dehydrogenase-like predicted oxidoreductase